jgi:hypothetical protein
MFLTIKSLLANYLWERHSFKRFTKKNRHPILNRLHAVGLRADFNTKVSEKFVFTID